MRFPIEEQLMNKVYYPNFTYFIYKLIYYNNINLGEPCKRVTRGA
jgi:hypothetical protein